MLAACAQILAIAVVEPSSSVEVLSISSAEFYSSRGCLDRLAPVEACQNLPQISPLRGGHYGTLPLWGSHKDRSFPDEKLYLDPAIVLAKSEILLKPKGRPPMPY